MRDEDVYKDDPRTEHEAAPVTDGVKYAANFWSHLRDFQNFHAANCGTAAVCPGVDEGVGACTGRAARCYDTDIFPVSVSVFLVPLLSAGCD